MSKGIKSLLIMLSVTILLSGCAKSSSDVQSEDPIGGLEGGIVVDNFATGGHPIELHFKKSPDRIVAVWQNSVETLLALGAGDKIVAALGVPYTDCLRPEYRYEYEKIPIKQFQLLDTEHILMLEPDFILAWSSTFSEKTTKPTSFWHGRNINTYYAANTMPGKKERTIEDEYNYILDIGKIIGKKHKAIELVNGMKNKIASVQQATKDYNHPRTIIIEQMKDNYMVYGSNSLAGDILQQVNGELIQTGKTISYEEMIEANPDVIFMVYSEFNYANADKITSDFLSKPALQDISAIKNKRVYNLPLYSVYGSATRTYDGICLMAAGLYPDLFGGKNEL